MLPPSPLKVWWSIKYHAKGCELSHSSLITDDKERNKIYPQVQSSHWFRSLMFGLKTFALPSSVTEKRIYENTESLQFQSEPQIKKKLLNKIPTSSQGYEEITLVELQTLKNTVLKCFRTFWRKLRPDTWLLHVTLRVQALIAICS